MAEKMSPCPFCDHSGPFDQWPCEWLDATEANVVRCPMCHGAAPSATWNRRHLTQSAKAVDCPACEGRPASGNSPCHVCGKSVQAVDVDVLYGVIRSFGYTTRDQSDELATAVFQLITRAIGNAQAEGWNINKRGDVWDVTYTPPTQATPNAHE